jgi:hypothetical protein
LFLTRHGRRHQRRTKKLSRFPGSRVDRGSCRGTLVELELPWIWPELTAPTLASGRGIRRHRRLRHWRPVHTLWCDLCESRSSECHRPRWREQRCWRRATHGNESAEQRVYQRGWLRSGFVGNAFRNGHGAVIVVGRSQTVYVGNIAHDELERIQRIFFSLSSFQSGACCRKLKPRNSCC